jgi:hypothetical protein
MRTAHFAAALLTLLGSTVLASTVLFLSFQQTSTASSVRAKPALLCSDSPAGRVVSRRERCRTWFSHVSVPALGTTCARSQNDTCSQSVKTDRRIGVSADGFEPFESCARILRARATPHSSICFRRTLGVDGPTSPRRPNHGGHRERCRIGPRYHFLEGNGSLVIGTLL